MCFLYVIYYVISCVVCLFGVWFVDDVFFVIVDLFGVVVLFGVYFEMVCLKVCVGMLFGCKVGKCWIFFIMVL